MVDTLLTGHRSPRWEHWLLDRNDQQVKLLDGVTGGGCTVAALSRLGTAGNLTIDDRGQEIDWLTHRVQSIYDPGITGVEPWPVATLLFASPTTRYTEFGRSYDVELLSKLSILDLATVGQGYALAAGTPVIDTVVALIHAVGETRIAVTPSDAVLVSQIVFDADDTYLTVINELLTAIGYWSLWCDGAGVFRVEPYENPADRPESWTFTQGNMSLHMPDWEHEQDLNSIPNVYKVWREGDEDTPGVEGVVTLDSLYPDSPYTVAARGYEVTRTESAEVATVDDAVALATRRLRDALTPVGKITATHAVLPLQPNQVIRFTDSGTDTLCTIQSIEYSYRFDSDCKASWRQL